MNFDDIAAHWRLIIFIAFAALAAIRVFYFLFFFSRLAFHREKPRCGSQTHPVSVIICARDEAANLAKNLPGALVQEYPTTHEVIVVNDNSYDESKYLLEEIKKQFRQLHVVELQQEAKMIPGKKFPLSIGIKTAKYEIVLLTDADCVPATEHWISCMQSAYDDRTEIVLGYGAYHKKSGLLNRLVRWETFQSALQYLSYAKAGMPYMGVGRNLSYKKSVFYRHKGFSAHNHIPGGDDDLFISMAATKHNTSIAVDKNAFTLSEPPHSFAAWRKQKSRHYSTSRFYKAKHKLLLGLYALSQFLWYPAMAAALIFYNWMYSVPVAAFVLLIQTMIYFRAAKRLNEKDLVPAFLFYELWMMIYYIVFAPALIKKVKPYWK